ncbi:MAG: DUF3306 domain-containing protein [Alphaproteobacteria bacterium]|nr:DUF3306 domain-containing protein [Alphaproteobacteria bacterium]
MSDTATDFWSRRKARVRAEAEAEVAARAAEAQKKEVAALEEKTDEEILAELELPDPDTLQQGDDFSAFMKQAVPERLRRRALRRLWLSNSALANLDGLLDYGEDFTDAATVVENLQTAYQVGKGMMEHVAKMAEEAAAEAEAQERENAAPETGDQPAGSEPLEVETQSRETAAIAHRPAPQAAMTVATEPQALPEFREPDYRETDHEAAVAMPARRRMRFAFEEDAAR